MPSTSIQLVNHACLAVNVGGLRIVMDPWLSGAIFDDGWQLLAPSPSTLAELEPDVIWISHEHPDHFSPEALRSIPEDRRGAITVLYQATPDRKVARFLGDLGYEVVELAPWQPHRLANNAVVTCAAVGSDSWIHLAFDGVAILNLNDCRLAGSGDLDELRRRLGAVDVLLTQFGYASWAGNPGDVVAPAIAREMSFTQVRRQIDALAPRYIVPFASFVWFCHVENDWWNEHAPGVDDFVEHFADLGDRVVVLYAGDVWPVGTAHDGTHARRQWRSLIAEVPRRRRLASTSVTRERLGESFELMQDRLRADNDWDAVLARLGRMGPAIVDVSDLGIRLSFDIVTALDDAAATDWDISLSSATLDYVMRNRWGRGTLTVNGRFVANPATVERFFRQTQLYYFNNVGKTFPTEVGIDDILECRTFVVDLLRRVDA